MKSISDIIGKFMGAIVLAVAVLALFAPIEKIKSKNRPTRPPDG